MKIFNLLLVTFNTSGSDFSPVIFNQENNTSLEASLSVNLIDRENLLEDTIAPSSCRKKSCSFLSNITNTLLCRKKRQLTEEEALHRCETCKRRGVFALVSFSVLFLMVDFVYIYMCIKI
jgi:hypothetical protein